MSKTLLSLLLLASFTSHISGAEAEPQQPDPSSSVQAIQEAYSKAKDEPGAVLFTPPAGWRPPEKLPKGIRAMVIGKGSGRVPPTISLGTEHFEGTLKDYLKKGKAVYEAHGEEWKDLGRFQTDSGLVANLVHVDIKTSWGNVKAALVIFVKDGTAYILTLSAAREEFSQFYPQFFTVMRSLQMNKTAEELRETVKK